ncbi:hypothetical protein WN944_021394 [Citrus x changshan-huyou]|uniref:Uncharacterized protein n=1 Tax=Citrus x changshan-huyou TaxID=2935761 RepID=A0AAP0MZ65_9ROSI
MPACHVCNMRPPSGWLSEFACYRTAAARVKAFPQDVSQDFVDPTLDAEVAMSWWSMCPDLTCDVGHRVRVS